jgi:macrodomain Ter protein organizer (MatP/YcbG family)
MYGSDTTSTQPAWEFYDLKEDPKELNNAINDPKYADIVSKMKIALKEERKKYVDTDEQYPEMRVTLERELK